MGPKHYIAIVNFTYQIFDKTGASLAGPTNPATFWSGAPSGDPCKNQRGDPYVNYDNLADRWVISYFANDPTLITPKNPNPLRYECIAVSKSSDPVAGGWFVYTFNLGISNDYPKLAVWPDGYYMISQEGYDNAAPNLDAWVFDRANMLNGNPATFQHSQSFSGEHDVIALPSDLTGPPPPAGSPNFYARTYDGPLYTNGLPRIEIFEFHTDWGVPANSTFGLKQTIDTTSVPPLASFNSTICDGGGLEQYCVPQPPQQPPQPGAPTPTKTKLEVISVWPMGPLQYRNFGTYETLVFSSAVNVDGAGLVGMRWYELRRTPAGSGSWVIQQQGTFAPADSTTTTTTSIYRWMGSIAMDQAGNMAMGYSVSNDGDATAIPPHPVVYPGIRVVGRLATDPPGEMTTPEVHLADGGSSTNEVPPCPACMPPFPGFQYRWGDYSAMRVDPADGCTFWYTTEYIGGTAGSPSQQTHVGAVRFPTCNPADLSISKSGPATVIAGNQITYSITVVNNGPSKATNVIVTDTLPAGVTLVSTSAVCTSGTVTTGCNIGSLANGASVSFTMLVSVSSSTAAGVITNTVKVSSDQLDPNPSDDTATADTTVTVSADLSVTKTCKPDTAPALAGTTAFCTMVVTNNGPSDAAGVSLTDTIVASTPFTIGTVAKSQGTCSPTPGTITSGSVTCTLGTIVAGGTATVTVNFSAQSGGTIEDTVSVTSNTPDPTTPDTATGAVTYISSADLSITKTALPTPNVVAGTNLTYTITASNAAGPSTATNVVVKDTLPGGVSVVSVTPSVGTCSGGIPGNPAQPLICTLGSLIKGASATITVVVKVNPSTPDGTILINNAAISSDTTDPNNNNNVATANAPVVAQAEVVILKTADKAVYKPTSTITYTIKVTNTGPSDALAVVVTDPLPNIKQAHYQSDTGGCTLTLATNILTCNLGAMPTGTTKSFNIYELIVGNKGQISNTAKVTSSTTDLTPGNNTSTVTVGVK